MFQKTTTYFFILVIIIGVIFLANGLILAVPTCDPPDCNVSTPINVSNITQTKDGNLGLKGKLELKYSDD
ncbi:MAG: hypothetical protein ABIH48_02360, partial [Candidatus Falkowbacteria bacterium]